MDFDGTLSQLVSRPELARPAAGATTAVSALAKKFAMVAIVSGRPTEEVERLLGADGVRYEGCYGLESGAATVEVMDEVKSAAVVVRGAWVEPKGASIAVHYREAEDTDDARVRLRRGLEKIAGWHGLELIEGAMVLELVPAGASRKDGVVERLIAEASLAGVLYAGDDKPDLEAFRALDEARDGGCAAVKVAVKGPETPAELLTEADMIVDGPYGLVTLLRELARP